jgi:SprT protein
MTTPQQQIIAKCNTVFEKAKELYGLDLSVCTIRFDLKGRVGGTAGARGSSLAGTRSYHMRFNADMVQRDTVEMVDETVPHEIAHIVCFMNPKLGSNHDAGWARVCRQLGGNGSRLHEMPVIYGRGNTYEYITSNRSTVRIGEKHHKEVQRGRTLSFKRNKGCITNASEYSIVGCNGRTFTAPTGKKIGGVLVTSPSISPSPTFLIGAPEVPEKPLRVSVPRLHVPANGSKADVARRIMIDGDRAGDSYEAIIAAIMLANGHTKALATSYYKNNALKCGVPVV